jgi:non-ribosomal peptide synthetase component F
MIVPNNPLSHGPFGRFLADFDYLEEVEGSTITLGRFKKPKETPNGLVHALIERQASKTPDAVAVQFELESQITYRQLNQIANVVARQLVCGRGSIIPICIDRSITMVVALLAVMKAGAAYVLVSPESPVERNQLIMQDTKAPFMLVDSSTRNKSGATREILVEELMDAENVGDLTQNLNIFQSPDEIAYVIYTSGTTGRPKGALLSHGAASTGLVALPAVQDPQGLRQLLCHSPVFSAAQRTILGTLTRGGVLCLASKDKLTTDLVQTITDLQLESLEVTPSMLQLMEPSELPNSIKRIMLGGEVAGPAVVEAWADKVELWTAYGLSECTQV